MNLGIAIAYQTDGMERGPLGTDEAAVWRTCTWTKPSGRKGREGVGVFWSLSACEGNF